MIQTDIPELFDRLPEDIFAPLAGRHAPRYMRVLRRLYRDFFGDEDEDATGDGFHRSDITAAIRRYVIEDPWPTLSGDEAAASTETHEQSIFAQLRKSGWLTVHELDVRTFVKMPEVVAHFLSVLIDFAERERTLIGGKVQVIYSQMRAALEDPLGNAAGLHEAADQAHAMKKLLVNTRVRAREAGEKLKKSANAIASYAESYFDDYLANLYIADYHELRTTNHPLRFRYEIVNIATELQEDVHKRDALLVWYRANARTLGDPEEAISKDFNRFFVFATIERYITGLDAQIDRVNSQAYNYLQYATRTRGNIEANLDELISRLRTSNSGLTGMHVAVGLPFADHRLKFESQRNEQDIRLPLARRIITPQMLAEHELNKRMKRNREVTAVLLRGYVSANLGARATATSDDLTIDSIPDYCAYVTLARLAARQLTSHGANLRALLPFRISPVLGQVTDNGFVRSVKFAIEMRHTFGRKENIA